MCIRDSVSAARQMSMYIIREITGMSMEAIGSEFQRDHSTVVYLSLIHISVADSSAEFAVCGIGEIGQTALFFGSDGGQ